MAQVLGNGIALESHTQAGGQPTPVGLSRLDGFIKNSSFSNPIIVVDVGLSLVDQGYSPAYTVGAGVVKTFSEKGMLNWLRILTSQGFESPYTGGISGSTMQEIQDTIFTDVIDRPGFPRPHAVLILTGGNDINAIQTYDEAEVSFEKMKVGMTYYCQTLLAYGIMPIVVTMPNNGLWQVNPHASWYQDKWQQWLLELPLVLPVTAFNLDPLMGYAEYQDITVVTATSAGTTKTVAHVGHGYATGDRILINPIGDPVIDLHYSTMQQGGANITVTSIDAYTYTTTLSSAAASTNTLEAQRLNIVQTLTSDGTTHWNSRASSKAARLLLDWFGKKFPGRDFLSARETDFTNMVGAGTAATELHSNIGMFAGTGGTKTAGTPTPTGNLGDGWTCTTAGGAPTSVTLSQTAYTEHGYTQYTWQVVEIVANASEARVDIKCAMPRPSTWAASTAQSAGTWRRPTGVQTERHLNKGNRKWYVCSIAGNTGATEPIWPVREGETVADGSVTWECREGYIPGETMLYMACDYELEVCATDGLVSFSAAIKDDTTAANSVRDFTDSTATAVPLNLQGDRGRRCTPKARLESTASNVTVNFQFRVAAGKTVKIRLGRVTMRAVQEV